MSVVTSAMLFALGCTEKSDEVSRKQGDTLANPSAIIARMNQMTNEVFSLRHHQGRLDFRGLSASLAAITNDNERIDLASKLTDCVLSLDLSQLSYQNQVNAMISIENIIRRVVMDNLPGRYQMGLDASYELDFDFRLRLMDWRRRQIRRTVPKHRIEHPYVILDEAEDEERQWWRQIHFHGMVCYEGELRTLETDYQYISPRLSPEAAERIKVKIENYLGRPIRTKQQLKDDFKAKRNVEFTEPDDPHAAP